jgi:hypothetical protein
LYGQRDDYERMTLCNAEGHSATSGNKRSYGEDEIMTLANSKGHSATRGDDHSQATPEPTLHAAQAQATRHVTEVEKMTVRATDGHSATSGGAKHSVKARVRPVDMGISHVVKSTAPLPVQTDQVPGPDDFLADLDAPEPAPIPSVKPKTNGVQEDHVGKTCLACDHARDLVTSAHAGFRAWANSHLSSCRSAAP